MSYTPPPHYLFGVTYVEQGTVTETTTVVTTCPLGVTFPDAGVIIEPSTPTPLYLIGPTTAYIGVSVESSNCEAAPVPLPPEACPVILSTNCVFYGGSTLPNTNIQAHDSLTEILEKIDIVITGGDKTFVFTQGLVSAIWTIFHDMDKFPSVDVQDNGGTWQIGQVDHIDNKNLTITYSSGFAGKAYLN